jgi:ABC-2 type transport system ATP-binding protein
MAGLSHDDTEVVRVTGLTKHYGRVTAIRDASFSIHMGEILGLVGPNGAGKTTLLECLAGVQPADAGTVAFPGGGTSRQENLFYVPDGIAPWPEQPVRWAIDFSLGFFSGRRSAATDVIHDLQLGPLMKTKVGALSKGQRKRVLLALGLLAPQPVLVIDEPFEGLDLRQSREVQVVLRKHAAAGRTIFISIHQIADAARICDRFVLLSSAGVVAEGTLEELERLASSKAVLHAPNDFEEIFLALT